MPDEVHSATEAEFRQELTTYRVLYVSPDLLQDVASEISGGRRAGMPFFPDVVLCDDELGARYERLFEHEVGMPPHAYQIQARIAHAKPLLLQGLSVSRVAGDTGFFDASHFTRHFKRHVGVAPGAYALGRKNVHDSGLKSS